MSPEELFLGVVVKTWILTIESAFHSRVGVRLITVASPCNQTCVVGGESNVVVWLIVPM